MREIYTNHLIRLKEKKKISFTFLQEKTGISDSTLCRWFKGEGNPTVDDLESLFAAMGSDMREVFVDIGEQELKASEKIDYKGADALLADFERRERIYRENCEQQVCHQVELREKLQESFHASLASMEKLHADALKKRDETYDRTVGYLKDENKRLHEDNKALSERAITAEQHVRDIDRRRHNVFWGMLGLCFAMLFVGIAIYPPWG